MSDLLTDLFETNKERKGGIVVFVQSFAYLDKLIEHMRKTDRWSKLNAIKKVFCEQRASA